MNDDNVNQVMAVATVQIDNDRVLATAWHFAPGAETGWHLHQHDYVVVPLLDGTLRIEGPDGVKSDVVLKQGVSYARNAGIEHNVVNANEFEFAFIEIELR